MGRANPTTTPSGLLSNLIVDSINGINKAETNIEIILEICKAIFTDNQLTQCKPILLPADKKIAQEIQQEVEHANEEGANHPSSSFVSRLEVTAWDLFNTIPEGLLSRAPDLLTPKTLVAYKDLIKSISPGVSSAQNAVVFRLNAGACLVLVFFSGATINSALKDYDILFSQAENRLKFLMNQRRLELISGIRHKMDSITDVHELLTFVLDVMYYLQPFDYASAGLCHENGTHYELYKLSGMTRIQEQWLSEQMSDKGEEFIKWVMADFEKEESRIINVNEASSTPPLIVGVVKSFLNIPLFYQDELLGIISLGNSNKPMFDVEDLKLYNIIILDAVGKLKSLIELSEKQKPGSVAVKSHLVDDLQSSLDLDFRIPRILNRNHDMQKIFETIKKMRKTSINVIIMGETGTGKEILARAIQHNSPRAKNLFVPVNCVALNTGVFESELFGHVKGAFTGAIKDKIGKMEKANSGTLFLDEVGDIPLDLQVKLLRVIQEREVEPVGSNETVDLDIRIICATNRHLKSDIEAGRFRQDLYYRLNTLTIELPPLRDRYEDIPYLADMYLKSFQQKNDVPHKRISQKALSQLMTYSWPGNIRELENVIQNAIIFSEGDTIQSFELTPSEIPPLATGDATDTSYNLPFAELKERVLTEMEHKYLINILKRFRGNVAQACRFSKIDRKNFYNKMKRYDINPHVFKHMTEV
jgi:transcriptional regulator with GAF, ATPase, and Fis domain